MAGSESSGDSRCDNANTSVLPRPRGWAVVKEVFNPQPVEPLDKRWTAALDNLLKQQLAQADRLSDGGGSSETAEKLDGESSSQCRPQVSAVASAILQHRDFELVIVILICVNCFVLALYTPLKPVSVLNLVMNRTDAALNVAFTVEAIIRILALGSLRQYLLSPWNAFDALIVSMGYLSYIDLGKQATGVRALRGLRALRPLRTMRALKPLRIVVDCFFAAAPLMSSVIGLICFYIFITGLVGMQVFADAYHFRCVSLETGQPEYLRPAEAAAWGCGGARSCPSGYECTYHADPPYYEYRVAGFDNVGAAMLTAFQISTIAGWSAIFYRTWDATGVFSILYHLSIIVFVAYILVNCFLAGLKLKFASASHEAFTQDTSAESRGIDNSLVVLLKKSRAYYMSLLAQEQEKQAKRTHQKAESRITLFAAAIVNNPWFTRIFMAFILVNTIAMAMEHDGMSTTMQNKLTQLNTYLTYAFACEVVIKMIGQGLSGFFSEGFNVFDFFVVALAIVELVMVSRSGDGGSLSALRSFKTLRILKSFRVLRMLRMFRYLDSLRALGEVMMDSMESFLSVSFLCFLFLIVFAIIGLHTMGDIVMDAPNFNTFYASFLSVFQILTLENWEEIMFSTIQSSGMLSVFLFFVVWVLIGKFVLLSLFLAVILEAFEVAHERQVAEKLKEQLLGDQSVYKGGLNADPAVSPPAHGLGGVLSTVVSSTVYPEPMTETATGHFAHHSADQANPQRQLVPAFSTSQIEAAKRAQRHSMVAYAMQISGLRVPAGELEAIAHDFETARSVSLHEGRGRYCGVVQSSSGPMLLTMARSPDSPAHGEVEVPLSGPRMLSLTAIPMVESRAAPASLFRLSQSRSYLSSGSDASQLGNDRNSEFGAPRAAGWAEDDMMMTLMTRVVNIEAVAGHQENVAVAQSELEQLSASREGTISNEWTPLPVCQRASVVPAECDMPRTWDSESTMAERSSMLCIDSDDALGLPQQNSDSAVTLNPPIAPCERSQSAPDAELRTCSKKPQSLQQAAKMRQRRRLDRLKAFKAPRACQGDIANDSSEDNVDASLDAYGNTGEVSGLLATPILDQEHEWLQDDPDALLTALRTNPLFSIIAETHNQEASNDLDLYDCAASGLDPGEFLLSQYITESTCFGPSMRDKDDEDPVAGTFLGLSANHPVRAVAIRVVQHLAFDYTMTAAIVLSCGSMTVERPGLPPDSSTIKILQMMNLVLDVLFAVELLLKLTVYGFRSYWSRTSNKIDALIVMLSVLLMAFEDSGLSIFRSLRSLRAIKVLRVATRSDGLKNIISLIINSLASMLNVTLLLVMFVCIFAILGVQLFSGLMYRCNDGTVSGIEECAGTFIDDTGVEVDRVWSRPFHNFDSLGRALLTLFVCSTLDGWGPISQAATAAPLTKGQQPQPGSNSMAALYFVGYIVCIAFIVLQLYVGVLFYSFNKIQTEQLGLHSLDVSQKEWLSIVPYLCSLKYIRIPPYPVIRWKQMMYEIATSSRLEQFVLVAVFFNVVELCIWWHAMPASILLIKERLNLAFSMCFLGEMVIKIVGIGWREYWANGWNKLDFFLVCLSIVDLAFAYLQSSFLRIIKVLKAQKMLKLLRLSRMVKALKTMKSIFHLLIAIQRSVAAITQVGALMLVTFFVFAYIGVLVFGSVQPGDELNEHANFKTFGAAMVTLVRMSTNDNWAALQNNLNVSPPECDQAAGECGQPFWIVSLYFVVFVSLQSVLLINLFSTIILHHFEALQSEESWSFNPEQIDLLIQVWGHVSRLDGTISHPQLVKLLRSVLPPLGVGPNASPTDADAYIKKLGIVKVLNGRYTFEHTTFALIASVAEVPVPSNEATETIKQKLRTRFKMVYRRLGVGPQSMIKQKAQHAWQMLRGSMQCGQRPPVCGEEESMQSVRGYTQSIFTRTNIKTNRVQQAGM